MQQVKQFALCGQTVLISLLPEMAIANILVLFAISEQLKLLINQKTDRGIEMNSTTLFPSKNWSIFSLRTVLITIINQLQSLTKTPEISSLTTNIWQSKKSPASDRPNPKKRADAGNR